MIDDSFPSTNIEPETSRTFPTLTRKAAIAVLIILFLGGVIGYNYLLSLNEPPATFPQNREIVVPPGSTTREVTQQLEEEGVVRSSLLLQMIVTMNHSDAFIQAGSYTFELPMTSTEIARALIAGTHHTPATKITFPEGFKTVDILTHLPDTYANADISALKQHEGYLFPDTYFVEDDATFEDIITLMQENFEHKISSLGEQIEESDLSLEEVVIFASILEREGNDEHSMRTIAGILFTRLEIGMALQVDATFEYFLGKSSSELTFDDLEIDSPYNTYTTTGLPPTPIANPGLMAINAVLDPIESEYLYYLTGNDGEFYYARTFEEHKRNKTQYLLKD